MLDPLLSRYSVITIDEAHERQLNTDAILGVLKKIRQKRKVLRVIICSETINDFLDFYILLPSTRLELLEFIVCLMTGEEITNHCTNGI